MKNERLIDILVNAAGTGNAGRVQSSEEDTITVTTTVPGLVWELEAYVGDVDDDDDQGTWMSVGNDAELDDDTQYRFVAEYGRRFMCSVLIEQVEVLEQPDDDDDDEPGVTLVYTPDSFRQAMRDIMEVAARVAAVFAPSRN